MSSTRCTAAAKLTKTEQGAICSLLCFSIRNTAQPKRDTFSPVDNSVRQYIIIYNKKLRSLSFGVTLELLARFVYIFAFGKN